MGEQDLELEQEREQELVFGQWGWGTEEAHLEVLWKVQEVGQCKVEEQVVAEEVEQA